MTSDPFTVLGLPARAGLSDEDVRAAWRRIAAATHPDREDGGAPERYAAAAAAYDTLRTSFGRGEALADLAAGTGTGAGRRARHRARHAGITGGGAGGAAVRRRRRAASGRRSGVTVIPGRLPGLAVRAAAAVAVGTGAVIVAGWTPATAGVLAGALTWLLAAPALHRP